MKQSQKKIAIIGGGAAGMMCAASLAEYAVLNPDQNLEIHLFEKNNTLGVKVAISGGGRCNVTTGISDKNQLLKKYIRGADFLRPALAAFPPLAVCDWFAERGVPLKEEEDKRVFPVSDKGTDIVDLFLDILAKSPQTQIHYLEKATTLSEHTGKFQLKTNRSDYSFDYVVLTSGGNAYAHTGSSGDGYELAKACGHSITKLGPSLNSFETSDSWCHALSGISFENAKLTAQLGDQKKSVVGPTLFTHFGISGPNTFAIAAHLAHEQISPKTPFAITFQVEATKDFNYWDSLLTQEFLRNGGNTLFSVLRKYLPKRFCLVFLELVCGLNPEKQTATITREERLNLARRLGGAQEINLISRRSGDEFVTAGGISLNEVDRKTMRSKLHPNLLFAGEILDIDGLTGGFNLQSAWATGHLAADSITKNFA